MADLSPASLAIVGARHHLKQLYNLAHEKMTGYLAGASFDDAGRKGSDQGILALISLEHRQAKKPLPLTPDAHVLLFQVITNSGRDLEQQTVPDILSKVQSIQKSPLTQTLREDMAWKKRKILWNHATKSVSSFVHMPGPRKVKQLDFWWSQMWWMQPSEDEGFDDSGRPMPPARRLLRHLLEHTTESKGYGIRLANGTWYAFAHICSEHADVILQSEED